METLHPIRYIQYSIQVVCYSNYREYCEHNGKCKYNNAAKHLNGLQMYAYTLYSLNTHIHTLRERGRESVIRNTSVSTALP